MTGAIAHAAMGNSRPVLDNQHMLSADRGSVVETDRRSCLQDLGRAVDGAQFRDGCLYVLWRGHIHLVDDQQIGHACCGLAGMMRRDLPRTQGICNDDVQIGADKGKIVIAAVPDDDIGFRLGGADDGCIIDAGEHEIAQRDVRLIFLPLLDRAAGRIEIGQ